MAITAKDCEILDISWQNAVRQYCGRGYYVTHCGKFRTKVSNNKRQFSLGSFNTAEEADEVVHKFYVERLMKNLNKYDLNPDDAVVTIRKHLHFDDGKEFNLKGEYLGDRVITPNLESQKPKPKNVEEENRIHVGYLKLKTKYLLDADDLRKRLPKVGDRLKKKSQITTTMNHNGWTEAIDCIVTFVNREHLWYEVEFTFGKDDYEMKWKESFKLPEVTA